jgi:hypothetical protein
MAGDPPGAFKVWLHHDFLTIVRLRDPWWPSLRITWGAGGVSQSIIHSTYIVVHAHMQLHTILRIRALLYSVRAGVAFTYSVTHSLTGYFAQGSHEQRVQPSRPGAIARAAKVSVISMGGETVGETEQIHDGLSDHRPSACQVPIARNLYFYLRISPSLLLECRSEFCAAPSAWTNALFSCAQPDQKSVSDSLLSFCRRVAYQVL